ncbi:hypothetical protein Tco_0780872 [Tanacetum coccineum]
MVLTWVSGSGGGWEGVVGVRVEWAVGCRYLKLGAGVELRLYVLLWVAVTLWVMLALGVGGPGGWVGCSRGRGAQGGSGGAGGPGLGYNGGIVGVPGGEGGRGGVMRSDGSVGDVRFIGGGARGGLELDVAVELRVEGGCDENCGRLAWMNGEEGGGEGSEERTWWIWWLLLVKVVALGWGRHFIRLLMIVVVSPFSVLGQGLDFGGREWDWKGEA